VEREESDYPVSLFQQSGDVVGMATPDLTEGAHWKKTI